MKLSMVWEHFYFDWIKIGGGDIFTNFSDCYYANGWYCTVIFTVTSAISGLQKLSQPGGAPPPLHQTHQMHQMTKTQSDAISEHNYSKVCCWYGSVLAQCLFIVFATNPCCCIVVFSEYELSVYERWRRRAVEISCLFWSEHQDRLGTA